MCNPTIAAIAPQALKAARTVQEIRELRKSHLEQRNRAVDSFNDLQEDLADDASEEQRLLLKQADAERKNAATTQAQRRANAGRSGLTITGSKLDVLRGAAQQDRDEILDKVSEGKRLINRRLDQRLDQARDALEDRLENLGTRTRDTIRSKGRGLLDAAWSRLFNKD